MDLLAQPPLRPNAKAITHQQHPDHQLRIDRRATCVTVKRLKVTPQLAEIEEVVNPAQQVIRWNVLIEVERVEESVLIAALGTHHQQVLPNTVLHPSVSENDGTPMTFFNRIGP
jgi:hypothetical protein